MDCFPKHKGPHEEGLRDVTRVANKELGSDLLSHAKSILSLAQNRFTALFEMGRGGSNSLWPPSITGNSCALLVFTNCLSQAEMLCAHSYFHKNSVLNLHRVLITKHSMQFLTNRRSMACE